MHRLAGLLTTASMFSVILCVTLRAGRIVELSTEVVSSGVATQNIAPSSSSLQSPQEGQDPPARGKKGARQSPKEKGRKPAAPSRSVSKEHEAAVRAFVDQHHPELANLLEYLKTHQPAKHQVAVRNLFRTWERLAHFQERDPERYELEMAAWSAKSRADLLAAKLKMADSPELRRELEELIGVQLDSQLAILELQRQRQQERLDRLHQQIRAAEANRQTQINRRVKELVGERKRSEKKSN